MTDKPNEWRDEEGRVLRRDDERGGLEFNGDLTGAITITDEDARFLLRYLPEALGEDRDTASLPPLPCSECGKPIEPIGSAVALRFTVVNDKANWAQRYEHRPIPGAFHGGCAEAAFRRNAEKFNGTEASLDRAIVEAAERCHDDEDGDRALVEAVRAKRAALKEKA